MGQLLGTERYTTTMQFDARPKDNDKERVAWDCEVTMPDGEEVKLTFRDFACIPGRVSIDNPGSSEGQLWGSLAWGLIEPKHYPTNDDKASNVNLFRALPMHVILEIHRAWQKSSGVTLGESPASKTSSESTETS